MDKNKLYCGDNLEILSTFETESIDLVYIDPPFFSNRNYEIIWSDEAEIRSFEDRWEGGINVYIDWMRDRVIELHRVLKSTGSFYLHCDWHASHYLKVMCDEILGYKNFQNEIAWAYRTQGATKKRWSRKHDTLLFYTKTGKWTFNYMTERSYMQHKYGFKKDDFKIDKDGRQYRDAIVRDVWEIAALQSSTKEKLGYPTQKPEALLERVIKASSNENDIVLDAFCGCGTALAVSEKLGRKWIGIDISPSAVALIKKRLANIPGFYKNYNVIGMPQKAEDLKDFKPYEFQYWVINEMHGVPSPKKSGDMGIDGLSFLEHCPIQVKQSKKIGRNVVDNFETAIRRYYRNTKTKKMKGYIVGFSFGKGAKEEVARVKKEGIFIELITVDDILNKGYSGEVKEPNLFY
jgi:DNA modification methylase